MPDLWQQIASRISEATGPAFRPVRKSPLSGGCISESWLLEGKRSRYFVKTGNFSFEAEAAGLAEIGKAMRTPNPVCLGESAGTCWLVLEYVEMGGKTRFDLLGSGLAKMHRLSSTEFGWEIDNRIGSTPQNNAKSKNWIEFWRTGRLAFQFDLAKRKGHDFGKRAERLMGNLDAYFSDYSPIPSLLHGDLWRGNAGFDLSGNPVLYDPAVYYGDRETDLAMTELFGGFPKDFYSAYDEAFPLDPGYARRRPLYNLYHVLNHCNMFGGSYLRQAESMLEALLHET